jgi:LmbE family N-acetylglucosaminyl deacetylase
MKGPYNLVIIAHPDDESIFFAGLMMQERELPWKVICVTDGNADGNENSRRIQFENAMKKLEVDSFDNWGFPDIYEERLCIDSLKEKMAQLPLPKKVFTHGITGEYGHPHHQDVSFAVHEFFHDKTEVYSTAYNCFPDFSVILNEEEYQLKTEILTSIYGSEVNRFAHLIPGTSVETFVKVSLPEVQSIYSLLTENKQVSPDLLKKYHWLYEHLSSVMANGLKRIF